MRFSKGILGLVIVLGAVMITLGAGMVLNSHDSTTTGTRYDFVTDISGLWTYSETPQYMDYNPIKNWTGFYLYGEEPPSGIDYGILASGSNMYPINEVTWQNPVTSQVSTVGESIPGWTRDSMIVVYRSFVQGEPGSIADIDGLAGLHVSSGSALVTLDKVLAEDLSVSSGYIRILATNHGATLYSKIDDWTQSTQKVTLEGREFPFYYAPYRAMSLVDHLDVWPSSGVVTAFDAENGVLWTSSTNQTVVFASNLKVEDGLISSGERPDYDKITMIESSVVTRYMDVSKGVTISGGLVEWTNDHWNQKISFVVTVDDDNPAAIQFGSLKTRTGLYAPGFIIEIDPLGEQRVEAFFIRDTLEPENHAIISGFRSALVSFDTEANRLSVTPIVQLRSFLDYQTLDALTKSIEIWNLETGGASVPLHKEIGSMEILQSRPSAAHGTVRFGIVETRVMMNTYNAVISDASLNLATYFSDYDSIRVNMYSFAIYGDAIAAGGYRFEVRDNMILVNGKSYELENVAFQYADDLTFIDKTGKEHVIGPKLNDYLTVFGSWYFTTGLYAGTNYEKTETILDVGTWAFQNANTAIVFYFGALVGLTLLSTRLQTPSFLDLVIVGISGVFGYVLLDWGW